MTTRSSGTPTSPAAPRLAMIGRTACSRQGSKGGPDPVKLRLAESGGVPAYQGVAELGEAVGDLVAEAQAEMAAQTTETEPPPSGRHRQ